MMPPDRTKPTVLSIHGPDPVSGVTSWAARMTERTGDACQWRMLVVGPEERVERVRGTFPAHETARVHFATWPTDAPVVDQIESVRHAMAALEPAAVVANYVAHGFVAGTLNAIPVLAVAHNEDPANRYLFRHWGALAAGWWTVSEGSFELVADLMSNLSHGPVIPCGVPPDPSPIPPPLARRAGPIRLLYASRLQNVEKRCLDIAVLADALERRGVAFFMTVAGDGPSRGDLEAALEGHIAGGRARVLGPVPLSAMAELHREHDMVILVSANEGTPVVVMEAMAAGRPVALTDGCGDAVGPTREFGAGFVVPVGDMETMAAEIGHLGAHAQSLAEMGVRARELAMARFSIDVTAEQTDELIMGTIATRVSGAPPATTWRALLAGIGTIGPVSIDALRGLASGFLRARSLEPSDFRLTPDWTNDPHDLPLALPDLPNLETTLLLEALDRARSLGAERIGVFPAGRHSQRFTHHLADHPDLVCFIDDRAADPASVPAHIHARPILTPAAARGVIDAVIISSDQHEGTLVERAGEWAGSLPILTMYAPRPPASGAGAGSSAERGLLARPRGAYTG